MKYFTEARIKVIADATAARTAQEALDSLEEIIGLLELMTDENIEHESTETVRLLTILQTYINETKDYHDITKN